MGRGLVRQRNSRVRHARAGSRGMRRVDAAAASRHADGDTDRQIWMGLWLALAAVLLLVASGCSMFEDTPDDDIYSGYEGGQYDGSGNVDESDLPGELQEGTSLHSYRQGTLGGGNQGPLDDVFFDYDSSALSLDARELLNLNAEWLRANPTARIEIEGHCDSRGTIEYNLGLGARRATAVRDYLVSVGISPDRMSTISYGKELPVCHEETPACWAQNRRTHLVVLS